MSALDQPFTFAEFFAGAGMARAGLGDSWRCVLANDIDPKKGASYARNWGAEDLRIDDVAHLTTADIPGRVGLAWLSPPCTHVSLASRGSPHDWREGVGSPRPKRRDGLGPEAWASLALMKALVAEGRAPSLIVIENVPDLITANVGEDIDRIRDALTGMGYRYRCVIVDAALFLPQSRERLFIIAVDRSLTIPDILVGGGPSAPFHAHGLRALVHRRRGEPIWFRLPTPPLRNSGLADVLEDDSRCEWDTPADTRRIVAKMTPLHLDKLDDLKRAGRRMIRSLNYRTRKTKMNGRKIPVHEVRDDEIANCVRTASGGSCTQRILIVDGEVVRTRRITPREEARLMGLPDSYVLPTALGNGHDLVGDGVCAPVVRHLAETLLEPILRASELSLAAE